jgi:hypothetical protein
MRKLRLTLDDLRVESFDTGVLEEARGTVRGQAARTLAIPCCTGVGSGCNPDETQVFTAACCLPTRQATCIC